MKKTLGLAFLLASCVGGLPQSSNEPAQSQQELTGTAPIGGTERIDSSGTITGWALDPSAPSTAIQVQVFLDGAAPGGTALAPVTANLPRPDINASTGYAGDHGFTVTMPASTQDGTSHFAYVYATANGTSVQLPMTYVIQPPPPPPPPPCQPNCSGVTCGGSDGCGGICDPGVCPIGYHCADGGSTVHCAHNCPSGYYDCNNNGTCTRGLCP